VEGIGGEHYYLNGDEWEYIFDQLDVTSIPQYLFYDKEGNLKNKVTGFPGAEKMKQMIDELMNEK
jgi:thiol:disulfide interchange protein